MPRTFDMKMLEHIRRATPDLFWSCETHMVIISLGELETDINLSEELEMTSDTAGHPRRGLFPIQDNMGMKQATIMLWRAEEPGKYDKFVPFNTVQKY